MLGGAVAVLAILDGSRWSLPPYSNTGEAASVSAAWHVSLDVPRAAWAPPRPGRDARRSALAAAAAGSRILAPHARDFALAIGRFAVTTTTTDGVGIRYFRQLPARPQLTTVLADAADAVRAYSASGRCGRRRSTSSRAPSPSSAARSTRSS